MDTKPEWITPTLALLTTSRTDIANGGPTAAAIDQDSDLYAS